MSPLKSLRERGQAVWLDFLSRSFIEKGGLAKLIAEDGLAGVTSNPAIFRKAIAGSSDYDAALGEAVRDGNCEVMALYERLAIADIQNAADTLRPVYEESAGSDGFVSLEVSPYIASDTEATVAEAERLWKAVARDNVMIKVPGTEAGLPAIRRLIGQGININITLLFSRAVYAEVVEEYLSGLEYFLAQGGKPERLSSVASFFVSRIDTAVDTLIADRLRKLPQGPDTDALAGLRGKIAVANAKLAYHDFKRLFSGPRWQKLSDAGARVQRLLWASTSAKNPAYRDVLYVEDLIGPDTVNTMPPETLEAFRDHGAVLPTLEENVAAAETMMQVLTHYGISLDEVTAQLARDGVQLFADAFDDLLGAIAKKRAAHLVPAANRQQARLPEDIGKGVADSLDAWRKAGNVRRLWRGDATLWTGADESKWLGWLGIVEEQRQNLKPLEQLAQDVRDAGFSHILLIGMGGSSLGPEVLAKTFGRQAGYPELRMLDSTDPAQIATVESGIDIARTLFIVSSKSGTTLEPNILMDYFFARAERSLGKGKAAAHFIAITDPGSKLAASAAEARFRYRFLGKADIGGRYSILSPFGLVPAAAMGLDCGKLLAAAETMVRSCGAHVPPTENPGTMLGTVLGILAEKGRDKVTIVGSPAIAPIGAWLEQLIAESTGKNGKGIVPVDLEPLGPPAAYGRDRLFIHLNLENENDAKADDALLTLEQAGQPVVRIVLADRYQIGQEFFRWEIATAVAGAIIGVNPFDQPDVEASKVETRELVAAVERSGALPTETSLFEDDGIMVFADTNNAKVLKQAGNSSSLVKALAAHLGRLKNGDYCALLAYIAESEPHTNALLEIRRLIRDAKRVATSAGFGPRFLHSTGQLYKGGPNSGVFLQITCEPARVLPIPGRTYDFGAVVAAQARGDFAVLSQRGRRALRIHLGADVGSGLARLKDAVRQALG